VATLSKSLGARVLMDDSKVFPIAAFEIFKVAHFQELLMYLFVEDI